jgi:hypothetical protein
MGCHGYRRVETLVKRARGWLATNDLLDRMLLFYKDPATMNFTMTATFTAMMSGSGWYQTIMRSIFDAGSRQTCLRHMELLHGRVSGLCITELAS